MFGRIIGLVLGSIMLLIAGLVAYGLIFGDGERETVVTVVMTFAVVMLSLVGGIFVLAGLGKLKASNRASGFPTHDFNKGDPTGGGFGGGD